MPTVRFTQNIQRHVACPTREVDGGTVRDLLNDYFEIHRQARGWAASVSTWPSSSMARSFSIATI